MMNNLNYDNDIAIISLCTKLGDQNSIINPLTNIQYDNLAVALHHSSVKCPSGLIDNLNNIDLFWNELNLKNDLKDRIVYLLSSERLVKVYMAIQNLKRKNINIITRASQEYPKLIKLKLKNKRPAVIFYIGNLDLLDNKIVGIVGSRNIKENEIMYTENLTKDLVSNSYTIVSGGAKGTDYIAEQTAIKADGNLILFLSNGLENKIKETAIIKQIIKGKLLLLSEELPNSAFKIYSAMTRNKYIYSLSYYTIVVKTDFEKGGTWAGAVEALKNNLCKVYVKDSESIGFRALLHMGARIYSDDSYLDELEIPNKTVTQLSLFEDHEPYNNK